ncbi:MAG: hypothetical protein HY675_20185 [Chloroflexi bacterium]|nr:hypothetical protein [Chloroflexota bacterium]
MNPWRVAIIAIVITGQFFIPVSAHAGRSYNVAQDLLSQKSGARDEFDLPYLASVRREIASSSSPASDQHIVAPRFATYYNGQDGHRVLGNPISPEIVVGSYPAQYFEKARLEDHTSERGEAHWRFMYGTLVEELLTARVDLAVAGEVSSFAYADLHRESLPNRRVPAPVPLLVGVYRDALGTVFVPHSHDLVADSGHKVPAMFWEYINRKDLFPGGWLHAVGLPLTEALPATVTKAGLGRRWIMIQAFERAILSYDPRNSPEWQVELANVGSDYKKAFPDRVR